MKGCRQRTFRIAALTLGVALVVGTASATAFILTPPPAELLSYGELVSVRVLDRDGALLREVRSSQDGRGVPIHVAALPPHVRQAFLAAEDGRFYGHTGVDLRAVARAAWRNVRSGRVVEGGSTLTQQLVRRLIRRERTLGGKLREAMWALRLEWHLGKHALLEQYLNRAPFGNGTFGIEAASQLYFGREARHLSVRQAATLASLLRAPTAYNPYRRPERLERRTRWVLQRMHALGFIGGGELGRVLEEPLDLEVMGATFRAPHAVERALRVAEARRVPGLAVVHTTLDGRLQRDVEEAVRDELSGLRARGVGNAAALVLDNKTGDVLAYVGAADFFDEERLGQNDGVWMRRQPGSTLKPFLFAEAFARGFTPASVVADVETEFADRRGSYRPRNYDGREHGPVRLREALGSSYNVPAVRLAEALGPSRVLELLREAGFSLPESATHYGLGLVLGGGDVSLWELARAYRGLARGGEVAASRLVRALEDAQGKRHRLAAELAPRRFAEASAAALVTDVLSDNAARASAFGLESPLRFSFEVAAKTGTSKGYADNWTVGYTRARTVAVWAGNFDGTAMSEVSGITGAAPLFRRVMRRAMEGLPREALFETDGLLSVAVCPLSGARAAAGCPSRASERFVAGTEPSHDCPVHRPLPERLPAGISGRCRAAAGAGGHLELLPTELHEWARREGWAEEPWLGSSCVAETGSASAREESAVREGMGLGTSLEFASPLDGSEYLLLPDLPLEHQTVPVRVYVAAPERELELRLDGQALSRLRPPFSTRIQAVEGTHHLTLHRPGDARVVAESRFRVRRE